MSTGIVSRLSIISLFALRGTVLDYAIPQAVGLT